MPPPASRDSQAAGHAGVVVLGNGRSGTSMVMRMFSRAGFHVGREERLLAANAANPVGYFEHRDLYDVNERILAELDGAWYCPPPAPAQLSAAPRVTPTLRRLLDDLLTEAQPAPIAIKDPRIGALLALWQPLLDGLLHPVLAIRHPLEIARSLATRDGTAIPISLAAWEVHMSGLLDAFDGRPVTVVQHRSLLERPQLAEEIVASACGRLAPERAAHIVPEMACSAIEGTLHRNRAEHDEVQDHLTARQAQLWSVLEQLPPGDATIRAPLELQAPSAAARAIVRHELERQAQTQELRVRAVRLAAHEQALLAQLAALQAETQAVPAAASQGSGDC